MGGRTPEDVLPDVMHRLFILRYRCPMCGEDHEVHHCIGMPAGAQAKRQERVGRLLNDAAAMGEIMGGHGRELHEQRGDARELRERAERDGPFPVCGAPSVAVADETEYMCTGCGLVFPRNQEMSCHGADRECT